MPDSSARIAEIQPRLDVALAAARDAASVICAHYQSASLSVERKGDSSPVTLADREAERVIRGRIAAAFPDDGILGEEQGESPGRSGYRWVIDPLDGTKSFVHGVPLFGTLVGVEHQGRCVAGVCHLPVLRETVWGGRGLGAWWQTADGATQPARVSAVADLSQALVCFTTVQGFARVGRPEVFETLVRSARLVRGWGDCYGYVLVATGRAEIMLDPLMNPWDAGALVPILEEAGGRFSDWDGAVSIHTGNGLATNGALHDAALQIVRK